MMSIYLCPLCKSKLEKTERSLKCEHGHSFDISAEGYVHLLPPNKMNSKIPGDSKEMAASRSAFLDKGYYEPLLLELEKTVLELAEGEEPSVLDCGCGEGYYTANIAKELKNRIPKAKIAGFDISRPSVKRAAKRTKEVEFAVASVFDIPVPDESFDVLLNVFSPLSIDEYRRVLKKEGYYIYVVPAARHLWQLKAAIYDVPYENREQDTPYEGFEHLETKRVRYEADIKTKEDIFALFQMTPYYWKTSAKGAEKLGKLDSLRTEVAFDIHVYKKIK
ncbi:MAG: methyltransferase domain-containing protein [Oscillospiraceae bacterium]|nr:methyltransferase domain-containing protein [Oscillospiraceae bacterium]